MGLAQSLLIVPSFALALAHLQSVPSQALVSLVATLLTPFVVLVNLAVYAEARDPSGAGAAQLRADLDAP